MTATNAATLSGSQAYTLTVTAVPVVLAPTTLPNGIVGTAYNQTITASGPAGPFTFAVTTGTLPAGLTLTAAGALTGTPTAAIASTFTVTATSPANLTGSLAYTLTVTAVPVVVSPIALPNGAVGTAYNQTITATGPAGPFTFAVTTGTLPAGLTLTAAGALTGTPTTAAASTFTVTATSPANLTGNRAYTLTVTTPPPPAATPILVGGLLNGTAAVFNPVNNAYQTGASKTFAGFPRNVRTATADVNNDGVPDFIGGSGPGSVNVIAVIDGKTGATLVSFSPFETAFAGGLFVAVADMNRDGFADVIVTPDQGGGPIVAIYSGKSFAAGTGGEAAQLDRFFGIDDPAFRGGARAAAGDVNGDKTPDLVVSAGFGGGPRIAIFDGSDIAPGRTPRKFVGDFLAFEERLRNGAFVTVGDMTNDGKAELVFGGGPNGAPRVRIFDGSKLLAAGAFTNLDAVATQSQISDFFAGNSSLRGGVHLAIGNVDGDGRADLITSSGDNETSAVRLYRATTILANAASPSPDQTFDPFGAILANGVFVG